MKSWPAIIFIILSSCTNNNGKYVQVTSATSAKEIIPDSNSITVIDSVTITDEYNDCVRGQAEPVIKKEVYPNTTFTLQPDSLTSIETVRLPNGDTFYVHNWGCEYYTLTFRFETSRFSASEKNLKYWYHASQTLMTNVLSGIDAPIDIKKGIMYIGYYAGNHRNNLKLQDEIDFGGTDIRDFATLDKIEKLTTEKYAVEISFITGPL